jgi:hypothetical protein
VPQAPAAAAKSDPAAFEDLITPSKPTRRNRDVTLRVVVRMGTEDLAWRLPRPGVSTVRHNPAAPTTCCDPGRLLAARRPRRAVRRGDNGGCSGSAIAEHTLSAFDPRPQPLLEILVLLALGDVRADRGADDLGHGLIVYGSHGLEFVGLVSGQPDCHGFSRFHYSIMPYWWLEA